MQRHLTAVAVCAVLLAGCGHKKPKKVAAVPVPVRPSDTETGLASWYGHPYHGRPAANGEIYDMEKLTAAHRTLPFDTLVRVENLTNGRAVELRITDRGPFVAGRIIDVSHAAARVLGMIGPGTAQVRLEVLKSPQVTAQPMYTVQVGAFRERSNADRLRSAMQARFGNARLVERPGSPTPYRVLVGAERTEEGAEALAEKIRLQGNEKTAAFVVRLDTV